MRGCGRGGDGGGGQERREDGKDQPRSTLEWSKRGRGRDGFIVCVCVRREGYGSTSMHRVLWKYDDDHDDVKSSEGSASPHHTTLSATLSCPMPWSLGEAAR